jgi:D-alanine--poly(phosphoribitol) ligase subunit 1
MIIRNLIKKYLDGKPKIWDAKYKLLPHEKIIKEYISIQNYLLLNHKVGSRVAICLDRDYRYFLTLLACMNTGIVFIPLRKEWPKARIKQIKEISGFKKLLTDNVMKKIVSDSLPESVGNLNLPSISPNQPLYCLFTSGTTGQPKGVLIRRSAYENFLQWIDDFFIDINESDKLLNSTDYTFDVALAEIAIALTKNVSFYCSNFKDDYFTLLKELNDLKITIIATVPNNFMLILDERLITRVNISSLKFALIAGARFPLQLKKRFNKYLPSTRIFNCYGPTEATIYCLARELSGKEIDFVEGQTVSVGKAVQGCLPIIVNDKLKRVDFMESGELLIGGKQIMDCYLSNSKATEDALVNINGINYYRTGDIAFCNKNGDFFVTGRNDDTIKVSGQRVNLSDIDSYVQEIDFIRSCASVALEDELRGSYIVLNLVTTHNVEKKDIYLALEKILPSHQIPQDLVIMDTLPLNNSGKICKITLKNQYQKKLI